VEPSRLTCYVHLVLARVTVVTFVALLAAVMYLVLNVGSGPGTTDPAFRAPPREHAVIPGIRRADAPLLPENLPSPSGPTVGSADISPGGAPMTSRPLTTPPLGDPVPGANLAFDEANHLYDRQDHEEARSLALKLLRQHPTSVRMRRIVVASSCIMGDLDTAQQHYLLLPERDRADMRLRCSPFGSNFHE
jgi:hypothetical protein